MNKTFRTNESIEFQSEKIMKNSKVEGIIVGDKGDTVLIITRLVNDLPFSKLITINKKDL